jgi:hypothetical protein
VVVCGRDVLCQLGYEESAEGLWDEGEMLDLERVGILYGSARPAKMAIGKSGCEVLPAWLLAWGSVLRNATVDDLAVELTRVVMLVGDLPELLFERRVLVGGELQRGVN